MAKTTRKKSKTANGTDSSDGQDTMSRCVALCQEDRWREAVALCGKMGATAERDGRVEVAASLKNARQKLEYSLRRQMAAGVCEALKDLLEKEYLLDVG